MLNFERCASVTLRGCTFDLSGEPVTAIDSDLSITTSLIDWTGQYWWIPAANRWTNTGPGLVVRNSHVAILGSIVEGADRIASTPGLYAGVGARVESGSLDVGPYSTLAGGLAFGSRYGRYSMPSPTAGTITVDPRAAPLVHPTATPWSVPGEIPATYHDWLVAGETYHVSVVGPNNGWAMLVVGGLAPTPVTVPGLGASPMDLASATVMGLRLLDSNGWTEWTRQCPVNVPVALPFVFQAAVLAPTGSMALTYPSPFTVAWPHGYIP